MTSPVRVFMSCVTVATTSSPVFAFFASTLLVSCTGMTLPGAGFIGPVWGWAGCTWAVWPWLGCTADGLGACGLCVVGGPCGSVGGVVPGCIDAGCCGCVEAGFAVGLSEEGFVFCAGEFAINIAPRSAARARKFLIDSLLHLSVKARNNSHSLRCD